jgi:tetratricopeptide (TPR) repeat protein
LQAKPSLPSILVAAGMLLAAGVAPAAPSGGGSRTPPPATPSPSESPEVNLYDQGMELVRNERFEEARKLFATLVEKDRKDADALNMLAYTQRKTGDLDAALANYKQALELRPKFPQAREYLGEAYLELALREAETLRKYGGDGKDELKQLIAAVQAAAAQLDGSGSGSGSANKW